MVFYFPRPMKTVDTKIYKSIRTTVLDRYSFDFADWFNA